MTQGPTRTAISARDRLLNLAKAKGEEFGLVLIRYALERFLFRLSQSEHRERFVLKGAMLFQIWNQEPHRATRDMDFLARGDVSILHVTQAIQEICAIPNDIDGLIFDLSKLAVTPIREEDEYGGIRARFLALLGSARIVLQLDFGIGDAVTPPPVEAAYPTLLGMPAPSILAYQPETVIAEKLQIIVSLGLLNSRLKDYFDLWFFATSFEFDGAILLEAIQQTFARRGTDLPDTVPPGLSASYANDAARQAQWNSYRTKTSSITLELDEMVRIIREFAMPLFEAARAST